MIIASPIRQHRGDRLALALDDQSCSRDALLATIDHLAARLPLGGRTGLLLPNRIDSVPLFLAAATAGSAMVLDPKWPLAQAGRILRAWPPDLLVTEPDRAAALAPVLTTTAIPAIDPATLNQTVPVTDAATLAAWQAAADVGGRSFFIGFTSGTTGLPKAFHRSHRSWLESFAAARHCFGTGPDDVILAPGPLSHGLTLFAAVEGLAAGARVHLAGRFDADVLWARARAIDASILVVVPTMLHALIDAAERNGRPLPAVRAVISAGARLDPGLVRRALEWLPRADLLDYYGASELSFVSVASARAGNPPGSVGRPFPGVAVSIRQPDGSPAAPGAIGEVFIRSTMVCTGYLPPSGRPADGTPAQLRRHGDWVGVGDHGRIDPAGFLFLSGRPDDLMITGGFNVYPDEVEAVLLRQPELAEAAVMALPDPQWGDQICAVLRWRGPARLTAADLRDRLAADLARYKIPKRFLTITAMPLTYSGKVARAALRDRLIAADPALEPLC